MYICTIVCTRPYVLIFGAYVESQHNIETWRKEYAFFQKREENRIKFQNDYNRLSGLRKSLSTLLGFILSCSFFLTVTAIPIGLPFGWGIVAYLTGIYVFVKYFFPFFFV